MLRRHLVGLGVAIALATVPLVLEAQAPPKPAFVITLDNGGFANQQLTLTPVNATYTNNLWKSSRDPRIDRIDLSSYDNPGTELKFGVGPVPGRYAFDKSDEDKDDRNPYRRFDLLIQDRGAAGPRSFRPDHIEVNITKLDAVGGRIEGTIRAPSRAG